MNYCGNCGCKLNENSNFCPKCGKPTRLGIEKIKEKNIKKREVKNQKILLNTGLALIIIASLIFSLFSFNNISMLFKVIFLSVESIVFIYTSIILKKRTDYGYKALYMIGVLLVPIIFCLLTSNELLGSFLEGANIFIYLAISFLVCSIIYIISYKFTKTKAYLYFSYIFLNAFALEISLYVYKLINNNVWYDDVLSYAIPFTSIIIFNLILQVITLFKENNISSTFRKYIRVLLVIMIIPIIVFLFFEDSDLNIFIIIDCIVYILSSYIILFKSRNSAFNMVMPPFIILILLLLTNYVLEDYNNISIFMSITVILLQFFISYLLNNKSFKIVTYIFSTITLLIILSVSLNYGYVLSLICFGVVLASNIFTYKIETSKTYKVILNSYIIFDIFFVVLSLVKMLSITSNEYICLVASVIYSLIYVVLKTRKSKMCVAYEILSYIFIIISSLFLSGNNMLVNIVHEVIWIYYFMLKLYFDDKPGVRNFLLIGTIVNLFILFIKMDVQSYYIFVSFAALFTFISLVTKNVKKLNSKVFEILGIVSIVLASMENFNDYNIMGVCFNILGYAFIYYNTFRNKDLAFIFRYLYTLLGFFIIYNLFRYFIDITVISSILSLVTFVIILTIMFLMRVETDRKLICYTPVILIPYYSLVGNIDAIANYNLEFAITPLIIYILIFGEKVIKFKDSALKYVFELVLLSMIYITIITNIHDDTVLYIYSLVLSVVYVIIGLTKKDSPFVTFGCVTLLITTIFLFFEVQNSLVLVFSILFIGVSLITYISMKESKNKDIIKK